MHNPPTLPGPVFHRSNIARASDRKEALITATIFLIALGIAVFGVPWLFGPADAPFPPGRETPAPVR